MTYFSENRKISGWSNTNFSWSTTVVPETLEVVQAIIVNTVERGKKVLARGGGLSYGDQSLNSDEVVIDMSEMNEILEFDDESGRLRVQSGATYDQVLLFCLERGWILPVIPGTRYVTMGGALSNNVHGKNSYRRRNFGEWVMEFKIVLASGEYCACSKKINNELFLAVIGGAGLLGVVVEMTLQLVRVPSSYLSTQTITAPSLHELLDVLDKVSEENDFAIAQVDCFSKSSGLGRGTISGGSFIASERDRQSIEVMRNISKRMFGVIPKGWVPKFGKYIVNDYTMQWVSRLKYHLDKKSHTNKPTEQNIYQFTFLMDNIPDWKHVFRHGFFEYQPMIPREKARTIIPQLIKLTHEYGMPAYLSGIKIHSRDNFLLSYSLDGYSFAMDIPRRPQEKEKQDSLFREMNKIVIQARGIIYLAKDANLTAAEFRKMYKNVDKFLALKKKYDPNELFQSDMYRRIFQNNKQ